MALHEVRRDGDYEIVGALTTVTDDFARVSMHGVREEPAAQRSSRRRGCLRSCAHSFSVPERDLRARNGGGDCAGQGDGITHVIFGDLYLEDIRAYRETRLTPIG